MDSDRAGRGPRPGFRECLKGEAACNAAFWVFVVLFVVQLLHFMEHVVQVHQIFLGSANTSGVAGHHFDFVEVHLAYNVGVWLSLVTAWMLWRMEPGAWRRGNAADLTFAGIVIFQGYHAGEHIYQAYQYFALNAGPRPPGLIGQYIPNPIAHFDLNLILTLWMTAMLIFLRPKRLPWGHRHPHDADDVAVPPARPQPQGSVVYRRQPAPNPDAAVRLKRLPSPVPETMISPRPLGPPPAQLTTAPPRPRSNGQWVEVAEEPHNHWVDVAMKTRPPA